MNRRKFFRWLGLGTAVAAAAPSTLLAMGPACVETCCSCSGRSFWEGACDYCHENVMECGCNRTKGCTCKVLDYRDYASFSMVSVNESIDRMVSDAAAELSRQAGLSIRELAV